MEIIKVFTGMEVHGEVDMVVLKTLSNGMRICWFDHKTDDEDGSWDELWLAQKNPYSFINAEWYGVDSKNIGVDLKCDYDPEIKARFKR